MAMTTPANLRGGFVIPGVLTVILSLPGSGKGNTKINESAITYAIDDSRLNTRHLRRSAEQKVPYRITLALPD